MKLDKELRTKVDFQTRLVVINKTTCIYFTVPFLYMLLYLNLTFMYVFLKIIEQNLQINIYLSIFYYIMDIINVLHLISHIFKQ